MSVHPLAFISTDNQEYTVILNKISSFSHITLQFCGTVVVFMICLFQIWMCGGQMVDAPCSRVGHIYRKFAPFPNPQKGDFVGRVR
jgi:hypothetical protein